MEAPALVSGRRCSWCGNLNSPDDNVCSKCGAVFSSIQAVVVPEAEPAVSTQSEITNSSDQEAVLAVVDSSVFDKISNEAMKGLGLGPAFVSVYRVALVVAGCLSLFILISIANAVVDISLIQVLSKTEGLQTAPGGVNERQILRFVISVLLTLVVLLTAAFFLIWIYRAHKNLKAFGAAELKYSPRWAVAGFFVPLLNIFRPYQVISEIWKASVKGAGRGGGTNWKLEQIPAYFGLWWGLWLLSGLMDFFSAIMIFGGGLTTQQLVASRYRLVYDAVSITCALLAITVVMRITARQETTNRANTLINDAALQN
jgi:Domain of unknown function (DUF4328)